MAFHQQFLQRRAGSPTYNYYCITEKLKASIFLGLLHMHINHMLKENYRPSCTVYKQDFLMKRHSSGMHTIVS